MPLATFNPPIAPSPGLQDTPKVKILQAEFGDGYSAPTPDGLNHIRRVLDLRWDVLERDDKDEIADFLKAQQGTKPFLYTMPGEPSPVRYTCKEWSVTAQAAQLYAVTAIFRQDFGSAS